MMAALAAASTVFTRNVELAQITTMPLLLASLVGSGLVVPLDELPHVMAELCQLLPLSPVMTLVRAGWLGGPEAGAYEVLKALATALAWTALAVFAVRRWFRWEPRR
jgi:ABC-2 type transport system permease protein